jgi:chemotaxis protein CheD
MKKPDNVLEIYLTPGEFHCGDRETRVRTLLGEGGIFTLWHARRKIGFISHFRELRRPAPTPTLDPAFADEALAMALMEMSRQVTRPREYVGMVFVHDSRSGDDLLEPCRQLLDIHGIPVKVDYAGRGNLVFDIWSGEVWMQKTAPAMAPQARSPENIIEIYLHPGEWYFGDEETRIKTLLGSCVSFTLWHPERRIGGMCHYVLPARGEGAKGGGLDGRYADEALSLLVAEIEKENTRPRDYVAKVFGGSHMVDMGGINVSERNVDAARRLIGHYGFRTGGECLGGVGHRNVIFDIWNGEVWLKRKQNHEA